MRYPSEVKKDFTERVLRKEFPAFGQTLRRKRRNGQAFMVHLGPDGMNHKIAYPYSASGVESNTTRFIRLVTHRCGIGKNIDKMCRFIGEVMR